MAKTKPPDPAPAAIAPHRFARHGVIEASAGTGKTYTIVEMVKDRVGRENTPLEEILILTFTDKAAAELQERIRAGLLAAAENLQRPSAQKQAFHRALHNFHRATIGTLHGFCHRVLREFGFESGLPFTQTVVDDQPLLLDRLREIQRDLWPAWYGAELPEMLSLSNYPQATRETSQWESKVLRLAGLFQPQAGDRLQPEPRPPQRPGAAFDHWRAPVAKLFRIHEFAADPSLESWARALAVDAAVSAGSRAKFIRTLLGMLRCIPALHESLHASAAAAVATRAGVMGRLATAVTEENLDYLLRTVKPKATPAAAELVRDLCAAFTPVAATLEDLRHQLAVQTVQALQTNLLAFKRERGLISFADMLGLLHEQLVTAPAAGLIAALRNRYRVALVDEFQDTDPIQWEILHALFVADAHAHAGKLIIIGDPKQSIYRFRGADVTTYLTARATLLAGSQPHTLSQNWRSTPELIDVVNRLFGGDSTANSTSWFPPDAGITFTPAVPPAASLRKYELCHDATGRAALTLCRLPQGSRPEQIHTFARWLAAEIRRLIHPGAPALAFRETAAGPDAPVVALNASHIAVLVRARSQVPVLQRALENAGVPSTSYRQTGLFASDEAAELLYLLQWIEEPADPQRLRKALLTRFFGYRPEDLTQWAGFAADHRIPPLLQRWTAWAGARRWTRLFASIEEETGVLERDLVSPDGDRRLTNLKQLFEFLTAAAFSRKLSLPGVIRTLQTAGSRDEDIADPADRQRIDTERPRVKIMTIHACKGLQFPVVFVFDPPNRIQSRDPWAKFHDDGRMVYDWTQQAEHKELDKREAAEENLRLNYVAATRAMFKLYWPYPEPKDPVKAAGAEMASGILTPAARIQAVFPPETNSPGVAWVVAQDLPGTTVETSPAATATPQPVLLPAPRPDPNLGARKIVIESFTHLSRSIHAAHGAATIYGDRESRDFDDDALRESPLDVAAVLPQSTPLAGREFGTLLHNLLEAVDFAAIGKAASPDHLPPAVLAKIHREIRATTGGASPAAATTTEISRQLFHALRTPLPLGAEQVPLCDIPASDCIRELEFQYNLDSHQPRTASETHIHGFIDLLFRRRDPTSGLFCYYLLDWKTNHLADGYAADALQRSMAEEKYDLQHQLYTLAIAKWLRARLPQFDFNRQFGGVFYLYLRGLNGQPCSPGICQPAALRAAELAAFEARLTAPDSPRGAGTAGGRP